VLEQGIEPSQLQGLEFGLGQPLVAVAVTDVMNRRTPLDGGFIERKKGVLEKGFVQHVVLTLGPDASCS
jgi:hypothetical protein